MHEKWQMGLNKKRTFQEFRVLKKEDVGMLRKGFEAIHNVLREFFSVVQSCGGMENGISGRMDNFYGME